MAPAAPSDRHPTVEHRPPTGPVPRRWKQWAQRAWWLHSAWALLFGCGVMIFARKGLEYADTILMVLMVSWLAMFVAFRTIVGPANRSPHERMAKRGVRLVTNYFIKQLYQQMFFFLVPLYAASATWSLGSFNWWLPPLLLALAVVSTLDLVFDNFIMERRIIASAMYGVAMFGVLNVMLPMVFGVRHFQGLLIAAAATPPAVALLSFPTRRVLALRGIAITFGVTGLMILGAYFGRAAVPPTPLAMIAGAVGHGTEGSYECVPASKRVLRGAQLDGLRCGALLSKPGGLTEPIVHRWTHGRRLVYVTEPARVDGCDEEGPVYRSYLPPSRLPADPTGSWTCKTETMDGQLVGMRRFKVIAPPTTRVTPSGAGRRDPFDRDPRQSGRR